MQLFKNIIKATYLDRPNRFIVMCDVNGKKIKTYMPNPGRLWELFIPGAIVFLEPNIKAEAKQPYTLVAVERDGRPIMLHTHKNNDVAQWLIEQHKIPGLEQAAIVKREVKVGHSRFDFLMKQGSQIIYLEVKSCTLFSKHVAMFPDAVTERGSRHLRELALLTKGDVKGMVLFVVHSPLVDYFMAEYHTDLEFSQTLIDVSNKIDLMAISVGWNNDLTLQPQTRKLNIPWKILERECRDEGAYLLILKLKLSRKIEIGKLGRIAFQSGYYVYVGSAMKNLKPRLERHKRLRKKVHWHIDYLRQHCEFVSAMAIRTQDDLECQLASAMSGQFVKNIDHFGSSDCTCNSHLFYSEKHPLHSALFHQLLQLYRMERLVAQLKTSNQN